MSKYSKLLEKMGYRILEDIQQPTNKNQVTLQKDHGNCWLFVGNYSSRKKAYEAIVSD